MEFICKDFIKRLHVKSRNKTLTRKIRNKTFTRKIRLGYFYMLIPA